MEVLEVCNITPSTSPLTHFSLPLTFSDLVQFISPPTERILFYSLPANDLPRFDSILQTLKHSLSLSHSPIFSLSLATSFGPITLNTPLFFTTLATLFPSLLLKQMLISTISCQIMFGRQRNLISSYPNSQHPTPLLHPCLFKSLYSPKVGFPLAS